MACGEVDGKMQGALLGFKQRELTASFPYDPLVNERHQAAVFGSVEECSGGDQALNGMLPTEQSFETGDLQRIHLKDGLVEHTEFAAAESGTQVGLELKMSDGAGMHGGIKKLGTIPAHSLGATESGFGIGKEIFGTGLLWRVEGTADADTGLDPALLEDKRGGERGVNAIRNTQHVARIGAGFQQDRELVATDAREDGIPQSLVDRAGNCVSGA